MRKLVISSKMKLSLDDIERVSKHTFVVSLSEETRDNICHSRDILEKKLKKSKVYGVNTGVGDLCDCIISESDMCTYQKKILMSHAVGVGKNFEDEVVRIILLLTIKDLASGYLGGRICLAELLVDMLNKDVLPIIPQKGSLGASGDLVPLSHMALVLIGEGKAKYNGIIYQGSEALKKAGLHPICLQAKEALSLINGTRVMTAIAALTVIEASKTLFVANAISAISFEALGGIVTSLDERIHLLRHQKGQICCSQHMRKLLEDSEFVSVGEHGRIQDAYSLRCISQVHGASLDAILYIEDIVLRELHAITDNPIILWKDDKIISGGNFHGQPIALSMDFLCIALAELANISERRMERLLNSNFSGLSPFLAANSGVDTGLMIVQYCAAALVSENKILTHPASVDSIPTSAGQEDHVSMGTISSRKARNILGNVQRVLASELLCACQAIDLRPLLKQGKGTQKVFRYVRELIPKIEGDRFYGEDIDICEKLIMNEQFLREIGIVDLRRQASKKKF